MAHFKIYQEPQELAMAEKHINDFTAMEQAGLGTVLGQPAHAFPGLAPVAKKCKDLASEIANLEKDSYELSSIRATLVLNFGANSPHNRYGFAVNEEQSTSAMVLAVLTSLAQTGVGNKKE